VGVSLGAKQDVCEVAGGLGQRNGVVGALLDFFELFAALVVDVIFEHLGVGLDELEVVADVVT